MVYSIARGRRNFNILPPCSPPCSLWPPKTAVGQCIFVFHCLNYLRFYVNQKVWHACYVDLLLAFAKGFCTKPWPSIALCIGKKGGPTSRNWNSCECVYPALSAGLKPEEEEEACYRLYSIRVLSQGRNRQQEDGPWTLHCVLTVVYTALLRLTIFYV